MYTISYVLKMTQKKEKKKSKMIITSTFEIGVILLKPVQHSKKDNEQWMWYYISQLLTPFNNHD